MRQTVRMLSCTFDAVDERQAVDRVFEALDQGRRGWICTVNVSTVVAMRTDARLQSFVDRASLVVADGQPLVWCAPLFGGRLPERVAGIELVDSLCERAARDGRGVYLLGATAQLVAKTAKTLGRRYPGLRIEGADGYFPAAESGARADAIRESGASLLFVGMGHPRQETFIDEQWDRLGVGMAVGVGGSFDVLGGARWRAPRWVRAAGLEWVVRLVQEPVRLLPRYLRTNTQFCMLIAGVAMARMQRWVTARR